MSKFLFSLFAIALLVSGYFQDLPPDRDATRIILLSIFWVGAAILFRLDADKDKSQ